MYYININAEMQDAYINFKFLRPDLKTKQDFIEYAIELFEEEYADIFDFIYLDLQLGSKDYCYKIPYQYYKRNKQQIQEKVDKASKRYGIKLNTQEYFRRIILYCFYRYGLFKIDDKMLITDLIDYDFIKENDDIDEDIKRIILELKAELYDDVLSEAENIDDKTLELENNDDYSLYIENKNNEIEDN